MYQQPASHGFGAEPGLASKRLTEFLPMIPAYPISFLLRRKIGVSRPSRFDSRTVVVKCISVYALKLIFFGCGQRYN